VSFLAKANDGADTVCSQSISSMYYSTAQTATAIWQPLRMSFLNF